MAKGQRQEDVRCIKKVRMGDEKQNTAAAILRALNEINESDVNDAFRRLYPRGEQSS